MAQTRYVNQNPFQVSVSAQKGGMVTFRPGEWSSESWYSRFVGRRKLTRVEIPSTPAAAPKPVVPTSEAPRKVIQHPPKPMRQAIDAAANEETMFYTLKDGIYSCRKCDLFRSGSRMSMLLHLTEYHKLDLKEGEERTPPRKEPDLVPQPVERAPVEDSIEASAVLQKVTKEETPLVLEQPSVFTCSHCGRQYKTESGLNKHIAKVHDTSLDAQ